MGHFVLTIYILSAIIMTCMGYPISNWYKILGVNGVDDDAAEAYALFDIDPKGPVPIGDDDMTFDSEPTEDSIYNEIVKQNKLLYKIKNMLNIYRDVHQRNTNAMKEDVNAIGKRYDMMMNKDLRGYEFGRCHHSCSEARDPFLCMSNCR
ncbi:unnamed protein product [Owenia fusiformis]|uniref:Uncharacterized protein n=1 Tax=Owenia fusiformis TaxID=6347 RepID=A0A8J1TCP3_OWEFU|nr:unnamed protein product [Owenia fusiformis]